MDSYFEIREFNTITFYQNDNMYMLKEYCNRNKGNFIIYISDKQNEKETLKEAMKFLPNITEYSYLDRKGSVIVYYLD